MTRYHDVSQLSTAELERAKRELQANLGLITPHSPAHMPIQAQMQAIDRELAERAESQEVSADDLTVPRRLRPSCQTGEHDVVDMGPGKAVGAGVVLEEPTTQCWGLTGENRVRPAPCMNSSTA